MIKLNSFVTDSQEDFMLWEAEVTDSDLQRDFTLWEAEIAHSDPGIVEIIASLESSGEVLEAITAKTPAQAWGESNPDGSITEENYNQRLNWRAGNMGIALDIIGGQLASDSEVEQWIELKYVVLNLLACGYSSAKVDLVIALEKEVRSFTARYNTDGFEQERNK